MKHRVFIAINLPQDVKKQLLSFQSQWPELPVRWTKEDNLHITLVFLGYLQDQEVAEVCKIAKEVTLRHPSFSINLKKVCYGPPKKMPPRPPKFSETTMPEESSVEPSEKFWRPRMIWAEGERSKEVALLKEDLEKSLAGGGIRFLSENREFSPHITLGRIRTWEFRQIEPEERPQVDKDIDLNFEVNSIEVMESQLKRGGSEYAILESAPLSLA